MLLSSQEDMRKATIKQTKSFAAYAKQNPLRLGIDRELDATSRCKKSRVLHTHDRTCIKLCFIFCAQHPSRGQKIRI